MAETLDIEEPQIEQPQTEQPAVPYIKGVYTNLQHAYGKDNLPDEKTFTEKMMKDNTYRSGVRDNLVHVYGKDNVPELSDFESKLGVEKKNQVGTPVLPNGTSNGSQSISPSKSTFARDFAGNSQMRTLSDIQDEDKKKANPFNVTVPTNLPKHDADEYAFKLKTQEAIKNTLKKDNTTFDENTPAGKKRIEEMTVQAKNQDITVVEGTRDGKPYVTRGEGFLKSLWNGIVGSVTDTKDAARLNTFTDAKELAAEFNKRAAERPNIPKSAPAGMGTLGQSIGGLPKMAGEAAIPYVGEAMMVADAYQTSRAKQMEQLYWRGKEQGLSDEESAHKAMLTSLVSAIPDAGTALALNRFGGGGVNPAAIGFRNTLKNAVKSVPKVSALFGAASTAKDLTEKAAGYDVHDILEHTIDAMGEGALMDASFKALHGVIPLAKYGISSAKEYLTSLHPDLVKTELSNMGEDGQNIARQLQSYQQARQKVEGIVPDEYISNFAGLIEKQDNIKKSIRDLEIRKSLVPEALHGKINEQISENSGQVAAIDTQLEKMAKSSDPSKLEMDDLTGQKAGSVPLKTVSDGNIPETIDYKGEKWTVKKDNGDTVDIIKDDGTSHITVKKSELPELTKTEEPLTTTPSTVKSEGLKEGDKIQWNSFGNENMEGWIVGKEVKTRGGQNAVELSKLYVESASDGKTYSKEYADANNIKYDNEPHTVTHIVPISEIKNETTQDTKQAEAASAEHSKISENERSTEKIPFEKFKADQLDHIANVKDSKFDWRIQMDLSQAEIEKGVQDIKDGKDTAASKKVNAAIQDMYDKGVVPMNRGRGTQVESRDFGFHELGLMQEHIPGVEKHVADYLREQADLTPEDHQFATDNIDDIIHHYESEHNTNTATTTGQDKQSTPGSKEESSSEVIPNGSGKSGNEPPIDPTSTNTDEGGGNTGINGKPIVDKDGNEYTSLKKRIYDTERDAEGKPIADTASGKSAVERANETKAKIESGEISQQEITDIATALANKTDVNTKLKPEEIEHVLAYDKVRLNKEGRQISKDLLDAQKEGNKEKEADLLFKDAQNQILREENYRATKNLNAEWGRQGQAIQLSIDNDYSFEHLKDRIGKALNDEDIPKATRDKLKELSDKIGDLQDKVDEHAKKLKEHEDALKKSEDAKLLLEEENSRLKAQSELDNKKDESEKKRQQKKGDLAKQKKDTIEQIKARYNKLRGSANSGLNFNLLELAPDIAKLARIHVEEGVIKIEELVDKMYDDLKDFIPDLSKRELRDVFSGYGKVQKLSDDKIDIELGKLKAHGKALSGLEDVVEKNQAPLRSGTTHREPTPEVKSLRKHINDEMRKRGIDIRKAKDPEKVWKTALESFKTRTENRIKYLENVKDINDIERFKKEQEKVKLKLDKEANDLKTKVEAEKNRVDALVKQYEFNNWSKFDKALHYANKFSKGVLISNPAILVKILGSVAWRGATKWATASIKYGVSKVLPSVSKLEGINTSKDLVDHISKYYSTMFSRENWQGVKDAFKNKGSGEDLLYGKKYTKMEIPEYSFKTNWGNPAKALADVSKASFFWTLKALEKNAQLHGSEKSAASKPAFEAYKQTISRNFERNRTEISGNLIKEGLLPKEFGNEHVQEMVNQLAFQKSLREKFMQDDKISNAQKTLEAHFRNSGNIGVAEGINTLLPITKIGSNFVGEALEQHPIIGAIPQLKNIFNLILKGENSLTTKQKYNVLRALTNQGVGLACYIAGAYLYQSINPFYQSSSKKYADKNGKDLPEDEGNIGSIPSLLSHIPYATTFRAGASHAWVWHQYDEAHPDEGVMSKFFNTSVDALSENLRGEIAASPYISMGESTLAPLLGHGDAGKAVANLVKSRIPFSSTAGELAQGKVPLLNKVAPELSKKVGESMGMQQETVKPSELKLTPKGFWQNIQMGVPGWRENAIKDMYKAKYEKEKISGEEKATKKESSRETKSENKDKKAQFETEHNLQ